MLPRTPEIQAVLKTLYIGASVRVTVAGGAVIVGRVGKTSTRALLVNTARGPKTCLVSDITSLEQAV